MKRHLLLYLALLFGTVGNAQQSFTGSFMHGGLLRTYNVYVPASYSPGTAVPLVLCFHGYTSTAATIEWYSGFNAIADTAGFIAVYPQGSLFGGNTHWNVGGWTIGSLVDDVAFTDALLDTMSAGYTIDQDRIYSTGMSNGGYMSFLLACQLSDRIAAVASVTGSMTPETYNACNPQHPTPVLQIHGNQDGTVPYNGDTWTRSIDDVLAYWVGQNNTDATPTTTAVPDINQGDGSTAEHIVYANGTNCTNVEHFKITGGDHDWPGAWGNMDIDASSEVWNFFRSYDINGLIGCSANTVQDAWTETSRLRVYPNPTASHISVEGADFQQATFEVHSILGELKLQGSLSADQNRIDLSQLPPNVYFLSIGKQTFKVVKTR